jgi:ribonuclease VapC
LTILVDASAIVAIVHGEPEADDFADVIEAHVDQAVARLKAVSLQQAADLISSFAYEAGLRLVPIAESERREAIVAAARYGKGRHPARLNMGDCFAYACAKTHGAELLYKGNDFALTDLA